MEVRSRRAAVLAAAAAALVATVSLVALARTGDEPVAAPVASPTPMPTPTPTLTPSPSCPPLIETRPALPFGVPDDLPWPSGAIVEGVERNGRDVVVRMRVRRPIADLVAYAQGRLADAGYEVRGGTVGGELTNLPFVRGSVRGSVELRLDGPCDTRFAISVGV